MQSKIFIVLSESEKDEEKYLNIVHKEFPFSFCITGTELMAEYREDAKTINESLSCLLQRMEWEAVDRIYLLIIPPTDIRLKATFWGKFEGNMFLTNKSASNIQIITSVWATDERLVSDVFLPFFRCYEKRNSLENGLKTFVRAQKRFAPQNVEAIPSTIKEEKKKETDEDGLLKDCLQHNKAINEQMIRAPHFNYYEEVIMPQKITVFSSSEADSYVEKLHFHLSQELENRALPFLCSTWRNNVVFGNGIDTINALIEYATEQKKHKGYAILLFAPDDEVTIRGNEYYISRDNVWLEYGLFSAILGPSHVFAVFPKNPVNKDKKQKNWHCPTDFATQRIEYTYEDDANNADLSIKNVSRIIVNILFKHYISSENNIINLNHSGTDAKITETHTFSPQGS